MTCPECLTSKVTPIVYGFPSPALVAAMRDGLVLLGGDYLVEGDPNWACKACQSRWRAWPFSWPDDALVAADERRRMRVNSRPGAAGEDDPVVAAVLRMAGEALAESAS